MTLIPVVQLNGILCLLYNSTSITKTSVYLKEKVKGYDKYPKTISFTYKGEEEFKTPIGGFITIFIKIMTIWYAYTLLRIMFGRKGTSQSVNKVVSDILNDKDPLDLSDTNFSFAFSVSNLVDPLFDIFTQPDYFILEVAQYSLDPVTGIMDRKVIPFSQCNDRFKYKNQTEVEKLGINYYYCPDNSNFTVQGNSFSSNYQYFELSINQCSGVG